MEVFAQNKVFGCVILALPKFWPNNHHSATAIVFVFNMVTLEDVRIIR